MEHTMNARHYFILAIVAGFGRMSFAAEPVAKIRMEMWEGCLCGGPTHSRTYEQLKVERAKRMSFGTDVALTPDDAKLSPLALLMQKLGESKLKGSANFLRGVVVYRRSADGQSYSVHFRGALRKFALSEVKDGDLIVYYQESY